jgi:DNA replication protein DnaC
MVQSRSTRRSRRALRLAGSLTETSPGSSLTNNSATVASCCCSQPAARTTRCRHRPKPGKGSAHDRPHPTPPPLPDELERLCRRLRLPYLRKTAPEVIATATAQRWNPAEVLRVLLLEEAAGRDRATIRSRRRSSGLPAGKTFDVWKPDVSAIPAVTQQALRTLEWVGRSENLVVCGPSGSGKSHFIEALGHHAIDTGKTVAWHTPETLAALIHRHRADDSVNRAINKLIRVDLICIDDVGLLPISGDAAEAMFRVLDAAYERRSVALSSNIHPSGFDELMPKTIATATVERLLHRAHVLITDGQDSYRLAQATAGKGVEPLT